MPRRRELSEIQIRKVWFTNSIGKSKREINNNLVVKLFLTSEKVWNAEKILLQQKLINSMPNRVFQVIKKMV